MAKSWLSYDNFLKPYHLKRGGAPELVLVAHVNERQVHDPKSHKDEMRPTLKFAEYQQELVINERNRRGMIMLFGPDPEAYKNRHLVIYIYHAPDARAEDPGIITIQGEWTQGDTWRKLKRVGDNQDPVLVEELPKPKPKTVQQPQAKAQSGEILAK